MFTRETIKLAGEETGNTVDKEAQNITEKGKACEKKEAGGNKIAEKAAVTQQEPFGTTQQLAI